MAKRKPKKLPAILHLDTADRLLRATGTERDRLLLMLARYMGLRVSELTKLQIPHLDFRRKLLMVREGKGGKDRCLPIPSFLVGPLRGWVAGRRAGPVFPSPRGGHLTTRAVQKMVKRVAVAAGLDDATAPRKYHPHGLRHVFASERVAKGVDLEALRDLMGHSSIATTSIYTHATPERLRECMEL